MNQRERHGKFHGLATEVQLFNDKGIPNGKLWYCYECLKEKHKPIPKLKGQIQVKLKVAKNGYEIV